MASFDAKRVTPIEWAGIGAGALALIISFFPFYSVSYDGPTLGLGSLGGSVSAWSYGFGTLFPILLLIAAAVVVLLPHLGTQVPNRTLIWLGLAGLAVVILLIQWISFPSGSSSVVGDVGISAGAGFGFYIGLLAAIASTVAAFLTFQASKKAVPPHAA
ncbi:hypothetical protein [Alloactinosynnema sp. L-07]|uniref:hypothetical protein n=1 Tax=Alloactinosynnema sp. L-07 TaxID=1653480 RepID=UPI00065F06C7|nr:hypothetical protein [Alloactinosynnema sp. L-07]CRK58650.1 hypothetical protein [Alloactinosynnema sp. L-07]